MTSGPYTTGARGLSAFSALSKACFQAVLDSAKAVLLSPMLFVIFMDRISWNSRGTEGFQVGDLRVAFINCDLKHTLGLWNEGLCLCI